MTTRKLLAQIERRLEIIETILHLRDPGATRSAEVFEGLRDRVEAVAGERRRHLLDLVELHRELVRKAEVSASPEVKEVLAGVDQMLAREGVRSHGREGEKYIPQLFETVGSTPATGGAVLGHVHSAAYVDTQTGEVISQGRAEVVEVGGTASESEVSR